MRTNRRRFDPMALIAGVVFTAIAIAYLLRAGGHALMSPEWSLATAAIGVGLAGLAGALWSMLPTGRSDAEPAAPTPPAAFFAPVTASEPGGTAFVGREGHEEHEEHGGALDEDPGTKPEPKAGFEAAAGLGTDVRPGVEAGADVESGVEPGGADSRTGTDLGTGVGSGTGFETGVESDVETGTGVETDIETGADVEAASRAGGAHRAGVEAETETGIMAVIEAPAAPDSPAGSSAAFPAAPDADPDDPPPAVGLTK
ncbi:hypothetical protein [Embleya hyalina]|uniref:Uncharacterized protein n=1 Tax=Embleya hyalina TaxID=516124 RepID=A0A401YLH8_9ACTN|nr:hypothetical protein [Embleya hyalina]GCD95451.1 hypothetical protein EHYA_03125 [Embleya hyalina]